MPPRRRATTSSSKPVQEPDKLIGELRAKIDDMKLKLKEWEAIDPNSSTADETFKQYADAQYKVTYVSSDLAARTKILQQPLLPPPVDLQKQLLLLELMSLVHKSRQKGANMADIAKEIKRAMQELVTNATKDFELTIPE
ncbi:hypothetical protein ACN47E_005045 [Coniothyrium glycines]